jgi:hypothetical protein
MNTITMTRMVTTATLTGKSWEQTFTNEYLPEEMEEVYTADERKALEAGYPVVRTSKDGKTVETIVSLTALGMAALTGKQKAAAIAAA